MPVTVSPSFDLPRFTSQIVSQALNAHFQRKAALPQTLTRLLKKTSSTPSHPVGHECGNYAHIYLLLCNVLLNKIQSSSNITNL
jgi:hypothetical protein